MALRSIRMRRCIDSILRNDRRSESLLVEENGAALVQLDRDQKPIGTKMNGKLRRVGQERWHRLSMR